MIDAHHRYQVMMFWCAMPQGVAKNFREVFRDLAPGGRGELVMQKRLRTEAVGMEGGHAAAQGGDAADDDEDEGDASGMSEKYSGVKVKVRSEP